MARFCRFPGSYRRARGCWRPHAEHLMRPGIGELVLSTDGAVMVRPPLADVVMSSSSVIGGFPFQTKMISKTITIASTMNQSSRWLPVLGNLISAITGNAESSRLTDLSDRGRRGCRS